MGLAIGALVALAVGILGSSTGLERDRAYYPVIAIVIALYYVLFAAMGGSTSALIAELLVSVVFVAGAILGFRSSLWIAVVTLAGHGIFDLFHHRVITNPGVPTWWPPFCMAADVGLGAYLAWLLKAGRVRGTA